jgi:hypothetical protein
MLSCTATRALNNQVLGFISRQLAQLLAPDIDCGYIYNGIIENVIHDQIPSIEIRIE